LKPGKETEIIKTAQSIGNSQTKKQE